jgi:hypothetical protein
VRRELSRGGAGAVRSEGSRPSLDCNSTRSVKTSPWRPQFVGDHRRFARYRGNDGNPDAAALDRLNKRAEVSITGEQNHLFNLPSEFHGIDRNFDSHVPLHLAATARVNKFLGRLGDDGVTVVAEPVCQRADRRVFLIFDDCRVVERAQQSTASIKFLEEALVIDFKAERSRR